MVVSEATIRSLFEVISCYFVNKFYYDIYAEASAPLDKKQSLTDLYRSHVSIYCDHVIKNPEYYRKTVLYLHSYYREITGDRQILLNSFMEKVLSVYIPEEHCEIMSDQQKERFLAEIIKKFIREMGVFAVSRPSLEQVIDKHGRKENTQIWVEKGNGIQTLIRDEMFTRFISDGTCLKSVDIEVFNRLTEDYNKIYTSLTEEVANRVQLTESLSRAQQIALKLAADKQELVTRVSELEQMIEQLGSKTPKDSKSKKSTPNTPIKKDTPKNTPSSKQVTPKYSSTTVISDSDSDTKERFTNKRVDSSDDDKATKVSSRSTPRKSPTSKSITGTNAASRRSDGVAQATVLKKTSNEPQVDTIKSVKSSSKSKDKKKRKDSSDKSSDESSDKSSDEIKLSPKRETKKLEKYNKPESSDETSDKSDNDQPERHAVRSRDQQETPINLSDVKKLTEVKSSKTTQVIVDTIEANPFLDDIDQS
jgi:hypothetical protein